MDENIYQLKVLFRMRPSTLSSIVLIIVNYAISIIVVSKQKFDIMFSSKFQVKHDHSNWKCVRIETVKHAI